MTFEIPDEFLRRFCGGAPSDVPIPRAVAEWLYGSRMGLYERKDGLKEILGGYVLSIIESQGK